MSRCVLDCSGRLPSQPLYTRLGLGESVLGYKDSFLVLVLPCTPSCAFHTSHGLLSVPGWANRGLVVASQRAFYLHTHQIALHAGLVGSPPRQRETLGRPLGMPP